MDHRNQSLTLFGRGTAMMMVDNFNFFNHLWLSLFIHRRRFSQLESKINKISLKASVRLAGKAGKFVLFKKSFDDFSLLRHTSRILRVLILTRRSMWRVVLDWKLFKFYWYSSALFSLSRSVFSWRWQVVRLEISLLPSWRTAQPFWDTFIILTIICYTYIESIRRKRELEKPTNVSGEIQEKVTLKSAWMINLN